VLDREVVRERLARLFARTPVADLASLQAVLGTTSRTTIFRILSALGYWTSYSHAGRYYTLREVPQFDANGLWAHGEVLFSEHHTLRATVVHFVDAAPAGQTHPELQAKVHLRVHDTLRDLVAVSQIGRTEIERLYLYHSADAVRARAQVTQRRRLIETVSPQAPLPAPLVVVDVLVGLIHHPRDDAAALASRLRHSGKTVSVDQVEAVLRHYELGKKKPPSKRSRR